MPTVPRLNPATSGPRTSSVGRSRINAPVEAFGGGAAARGLQQLGQGIAGLGKSISDVDEARQDRHDKSDIRRFQTQAQNIYNKYAILSKRSTSEEEVRKLRDKADEEVQNLTQTIPRSDNARLMSIEWLEGERGRRDNQWLEIGHGVKDRVTKSQEIVTRNELTSNAVDIGSLANNKYRLLALWGDKENVTEGERQRGLRTDLRLADRNFSKLLYNKINWEEDSVESMREKLEAYNNFTKNSNSLSEQDKQKSKKIVEKAGGMIDKVFEDRSADGIVGLVLGEHPNEIDELKSDIGQAELLDDARIHVDTLKGVKTPSQKARIQAKVNSMLEQQFKLYDVERSKVIERYVADETLDLDDLLSSELLSLDERTALNKVYEARQKPAMQNRINKQMLAMPAELEAFNYKDATAFDKIKMVAKIEAMPSAARTVFRQIYNEGIEASKMDTNYQDNYTQLSKMLRQRYKLNAEYVDEDRTEKIDDVEMTFVQRSAAYARDIRYLRELGDKHSDNQAMFEQEAQKYLTKQSQKTVMQLKEEKMKRLSK